MITFRGILVNAEVKKIITAGNFRVLFPPSMLLTLYVLGNDFFSLVSQNRYLLSSF